MIWVNLLPWRQARLRRRARFWRRALAILLLLAMAGLLRGNMQRQLNQRQGQTVTLLGSSLQQAAALAARIAAREKQLGELQQQQAKRLRQQQRLAGWTTFARTLGHAFPADVWLQQLAKTAHGVELNGFATDIHGLHQLQQALRGAPLLHQVTLGAMTRNSRGELAFSLHVALAEQGDD